MTSATDTFAGGKATRAASVIDLLRVSAVTPMIPRVAKRLRSGELFVPLRLYDKNGRIKLELALGKGKRQYDKRAAMAERESKRELERVIKESFAR